MNSKSFPWLFSILWLLILMVMIWAGFWQLRRAEEKRVIEAKMSTNLINRPTSLNDWQQLDVFDRVQLTGHFINTHFFLDNQIMDGQVGYFVFSAFQTVDGIILLLNRGWTDQAQDELVKVDKQVNHDKELIALVADWPRPGIQLGEQHVINRMIQHVTYLTREPVTKLLKQRHCQQKIKDECIILPRVLKLDPAMNHGFKRQWQLPRMTVAKHQAYATQWFTMSLVLCLVYMIFLKKNPTVK